MKHASIAASQLQPWAVLNDVELRGIEISTAIVTEDGINKGGGILSTASHDAEAMLLSVPRDLILSKEAVLQCAKTDQHLRDLVETLSDFIQTPRKAIVLFLLYQMTISSPDLAHHKLGVQSPFTDYFRALPKHIPLPTFYTEDQREMLIGTSLFDALEQKMASLEREFDHIKERTASVGWCQKAWWDEESACLDFQDWILADALYRSRALELPGIGDAMVPILDMANHSADERYNARFEMGPDGQVLLLVRNGKKILGGDEITINYGHGGASEMIFSYGFLEENIQSAREMFLSLKAPEDDPLRIAKVHYAKEAPGVRIFLNSHGQADWESNFVWWACVNEEDGLDFEVLQTNDGGRELQATWQGHRLQHDALKATLMQDPLKDVFSLRATVTIQERVERQGEELSSNEASVGEGILGPQTRDDAGFVRSTISHLRELELSLLMASFGALDAEKSRLLKSRTVTEYLTGISQATLQSENQQEEDFS